MAHKKHHKGSHKPSEIGKAMRLQPAKGDVAAHDSHHEMNKMHGTPNGFLADDEYEEGPYEEGMGCNIHHED